MIAEGLDNDVFAEGLDNMVAEELKIFCSMNFNSAGSRPSLHS